MAAGVVSRTLQRAAELLGGRAQLCKYLRVPAKELDRWIAEDDEPPKGVFLRAVDLVLDETRPAADSDPGDPPSPRDASASSDPSSAGYR